MQSRPDPLVRTEDWAFEEGAQGVYHVRPDYGRAHLISEDGRCWCGPDVSVGPDGVLVVHYTEN